MRRVAGLTVALVMMRTVALAEPPPGEGGRPAGPPRVRIPEGVRALRNLEYARVGEKSLLLDLYLPEKASGPLPVIMWVHGGGWRGGSKERCPAIPMTEHGYAVASINYRLSQEATFPAQIHDCKAAVRWLRANAKKYGLDPKRIGAWGASAGGHLVAMLGTAGDVKDLEGQEGNLKYSSRVQAVCDFFGPADLAKMAGKRERMPPEAPYAPESLLIGGPLLENLDKAARASPVTYVSRDDPPFLIAHGDQDNLVPLEQSQVLYDALKRAGVEATLHIVQGGGHGFRSPEAYAKVLEFFNRHLKPGAGRADGSAGARRGGEK